MADTTTRRPPTPSQPREARVLLVHSDASLARAFSRLLAQRGHAVTAVDSLEHALRELATGRVSVVVLDHDDHDGHELLAQLRARYTGVRRVVLSGATMPEESWVQRPVMPEELLTAVAGHAPSIGSGALGRDGLPVIVRRLPDGNFTAECPVLAGSMVQGATREAVIAAARRVVELAMRRGEPLTGEVVSVQVNG